MSGQGAAPQTTHNCAEEQLAHAEAELAALAEAEAEIAKKKAARLAQLQR